MRNRMNFMRVYLSRLRETYENCKMSRMQRCTDTHLSPIARCFKVHKIIWYHASFSVCAVQKWHKKMENAWRQWRRRRLMLLLLLPFFTCSSPFFHRVIRFIFNVNFFRSLFLSAVHRHEDRNIFILHIFYTLTRKKQRERENDSNKGEKKCVTCASTYTGMNGRHAVR